ncbi:efflux RND transporter permease subunit [Oceaniglobus indicus]|uniref:efflux RND transporter permease subunit n=1 Tax=Oceaniglobus indicus TaxID=2047749 RepID=UPI000C17AA8C|nr:efflux RND transporter permease subunit [Oceaniglobus indicus]
MKTFNLSEWALRHRSFLWFLILVSMLAGAMAYTSMGREEDPNFAIKTMIVTGALPGATVEETVTQVTDRIERKLADLSELDFTRSVTVPGRTVVYVNLRDTVRAPALPEIWQRVRNYMADIRGDFPSEFQGFGFNDSFGDVFGNIYALTSDGFTPREIRDHAERIRRGIQGLDDAGKVEIFGTRDEVIYLEYNTARLSALGLDQQAVQDTLAAQNAIVPSGAIDTGAERISVRVGGQFSGVESLEDINLRVGDRFFRLSDVAEIRRGYVDPPEALFRVNGQDAIGIGVGQRDGANILDFGAELEALMRDFEAELPTGIEIHKVADQPVVVEESVNHFVKALIEAVAIVLGVSFISLGVRAGLVVSMTIPLVLAMTFVVLAYFGITLQRISLGALIIALGLLVDDAMIAIETMISRLERGETLEKSASYAWTSIAFPMLTGTLVTVAGFVPIGLNSSAAGEFTFSLFVVIAVSLVLSWVVAVLFAPLLGVTFLSRNMKHTHGKPGIFRRAFHVVLRVAMRFRWLTIAATLILFAVSVYGMRLVENQFFPASDRVELIVDVTLPQNASITATEARIERIEEMLAGDDRVSGWSSYVGRGAPRFILAFDTLTPNANIGQIVIVTPSVAARDALRADLTRRTAEEFPGIDVYVKLLDVGPPVGRPVQYRISGPDPDILRDRARDFAALMASDARLGTVVMDWNEPARLVRVNILQDKVRQLGVSPTIIATGLNSIFDGQTVTQLRDDVYLVDIVARGDASSRQSIRALTGLQLSVSGGRTIPLSSLATFDYGTELPQISQRSRVPTITLKAAILTDAQPATITTDIAARVAAFSDALPAGYRVEIGGTVESSAESQGPIAAVVPLMLFLIVTLTMIQMQSFRLTFIVLCAGPLGIIGVVVALLLSGAPLGFVAILGILALLGILIRNSIILVHKIEVLHDRGRSRWAAVFEGADSRARPILLTAAAASLALIPISRQIFWGPMAYAMIGGIIVGTIVTLVFVPALYLAVFRVRRDDDPAP